MPRLLTTARLGMFAACLLAACLLAAPAFAQVERTSENEAARTLKDPIKRMEEQMWEYSGKAQGFEAVMRSHDRADWTQLEIDGYLYNASYACYLAINAYIREHREFPTPEQAQESGIIYPWPGNPFDGWRPLAWTPGSLEFAPGGLAIQLCPPELYSLPEPPRPLSYVMYVFGPTPDYVRAPDELQDSATWMDWATPPAASIYSWGASHSPAIKPEAAQ